MGRNHIFRKNKKNNNQNSHFTIYGIILHVDKCGIFGNQSNNVYTVKYCF